MSLFQKREPLPGASGAGPALPKAAVCFTTPAMTRRAADWLGRLGGCRPLAILSDDFDDIVWQSEAENADLLLLGVSFSEGAEEPRDITARCDVAVEVRKRRPECRVYLACEAGHPERLPALDKAVELGLIDGYHVGDLDARQMRAWLDETAGAKRYEPR